MISPTCAVLSAGVATGLSTRLTSTLCAKSRM